MEKNLPFIRHYKDLDQRFRNAHECYVFYAAREKTKIVEKIRDKGNGDSDSIMGTYLRINPTLETPAIYSDIKCNDSDRFKITKYRTGYDNFRIQTGRREHLLRCERLCVCGKSVQTISHVLYDCEKTINVSTLIPTPHHDLKEFFEHHLYSHTASILESTEQLLNIRQ